MVQNKRFIYKQLPQGFPKPGEDLTVDSTDFDVDQAPQLAASSSETSMPHWIHTNEGGCAIPRPPNPIPPPFTLGDPITGGVLAKVLKSDNPKFAAGDLVAGFGPYQEYTALPQQYADALRKISNPYNLDPIMYTGPLGMPGITAYSSLYEIGKPQKGETIFISSASGAVGALVGQIAKHEGLKVIGSVGSDEKLEYITKELGFDGGFNYKKDKPLDALRRLAPDGIDIYYENVGGEQLEAAIEVLNNFGRIVACGMISAYNTPPEQRYGVKNLFQIVSKRLTIRGFIQSDKGFADKYTEEHQKNVGKWLADGTFKAKLHVDEGIEKGPEAFVGMLNGKNFGKAVLKISDP